MEQTGFFDPSCKTCNDEKEVVGGRYGAKIPCPACQFDPRVGAQGKEEGMALVDAAEPEEWKDLAVRTGVYLAYTLPDFTSDEFYKHIPRPEHRTAMGPIMKKLERHGYIFNTMTMRLSESSTNHRRGQTVWKSKVYGKPMPQHVVDYLGLPEGG